MTAPRFSRLPKIAAVATTLAASAVLALGAGPTALAAANQLITGNDIANHSVGHHDLASGAVRSKAIHKNAVKSSDIRDGTITAADLDAGMAGVVGPAGPAGLNGKDGVDGKNGLNGAPGVPGVAGPSGQAKPDAVVTWNVHHTADGTTSVTTTSNDSVPAGALIEPLAYTFNGDFSSCSGFFGNGPTVNLVNGGGQLLNVMSGNPTATLVQSVKTTPAALVLNASCTAYTGGMFQQLPVPTFDVSLTFQWTVRDTTPTRSFN